MPDSDTVGAPMRATATMVRNTGSTVQNTALISHRPQQQELQYACKARYAHGVGHQPHRPDPAHQLARHQQVDRIRYRAGQHEGAAQRHIGAASAGVMQEYQHRAEIGHAQRQPFVAADFLLEKEDRDQQHEGRREEQDQPLEAGADVLQPKEIEKARQVITEQAQHRDADAVAPGQ
jgi:hypothetical protein